MPANKPAPVKVPAMQVLYGMAYTIKMSKMGDHRIEGYFNYVVPPLEGLWWQEGVEVFENDKSKFSWISLIRLPDFVTKEEFEWARAAATIAAMKAFAEANGKSFDINDKRRHHEIYLSDPPDSFSPSA